MKNKYTEEFKKFVKNNINKYTKEDFIILLKDKFNIKISKDALRRYLNRHHIKEKYTDYKEYNVRNVYKCPVGFEKATKEGTFIKVKQPDVWRRKTKVMYEKHNKCKLKDTDYVIFLNQDKNDYSKSNLMKVSHNEMSYLYNAKIYSKNPELTKTGILSAKLMIKAKEVK